MQQGVGPMKQAVATVRIRYGSQPLFWKFRWIWRTGCLQLKDIHCEVAVSLPWFRTTGQPQIFARPALLPSLCNKEWWWSPPGRMACAWTTPGCSRLRSYHYLPRMEKGMARGHLEGAVSFFWPSLVWSIRSGNCRALCTHGKGERAQPRAQGCHKCTINSLFPWNSHCHFLVAALYALGPFLDIKRTVKHALWCLRICPIDNFTPQNLQLSEYTYIFSYHKRLDFVFTRDFQILLG